MPLKTAAPGGTALTTSWGVRAQATHHRGPGELKEWTASQRGPWPGRKGAG